MQFEFATATRIIFGSGTLKQIGSLAEGWGSRALVVTGSNTTRAEKLAGLLQKSQINCSVFAVTGEPNIGAINEGVVAARKNASDMVIGFGGGSAIDAGKAIAVMLRNPGELFDYLEVIGYGKSIPNESAPYIAVPTTAGTGAEVTRNAVLASPEHQVKVSLRSAHMLPKLALVDPELTLNLPPSVTATTGCDALTQLIEPFVCSRANPMVDALCREGMKRVARSLRVAFANGSTLAAREDMALASLFGGLALANAGLGAVHGFAGPIGGSFPAPHGGVCAALLPYATQVNIRALRARASGNETLRRYDEVARILTNENDATGNDAVTWLRTLISELQIPGLRAYGITQKEIPALVGKAAQASSMKANPLVLTENELKEILELSI